MGIARCICYTNAKLAIKAEERVTRLQNSVKLSLLCFLVIFFALAKSDIIAYAIVILKPLGEFSCNPALVSLPTASKFV